MNTTRGAITITLVRQGDTVSTSLEASKDLFQAISADGGVIAPDWTVVANQPTIIPKILSSLTANYISIVAGSDEWSYNFQKLTFNAAGVCTAPANCIGKFKRNAAGTLTIINNLASATNKNADIIKFEAVVNTGFETPVSATIDVRIEEVTASVYTGLVDLNTTTISTAAGTITAKARLLSGVTEMTASMYSCRWWKSVPSAEDTDGTLDNWIRFKAEADKTLTITAADVDGQETFKCEFIVDGKSVSTSLFNAMDTQDPCAILLIPRTVKEVSKNKPSVVVDAKLVRRENESVITGKTFAFTAYNSKGTVINLKTASTATYFTVTFDDCNRKEAGATEVNGDITVTATTTY